MTPDDIAADRAVIDAATSGPGPWTAPGYEVWAAFIAAARTGWPRALDARVIERIQGLPQAKVAMLVHLNRLAREHQASFVPWCASPAAQGCGRVNGEGPLTEKQALYEQEYDEWWEKHAEPYYARAAELHDAVLAAFDACLEPVDLVLFEAS